MDENQFRAEIAEIFREQDRRFERAQTRMDRIEKLQDRNAKAIASLQKTVSDFMDIYQFREQSADN